MSDNETTENKESEQIKLDYFKISDKDKFGIYLTSKISEWMNYVDNIFFVLANYSPFIFLQRDDKKYNQLELMQNKLIEQLVESEYRMASEGYSKEEYIYTVKKQFQKEINQMVDENFLYVDVTKYCEFLTDSKFDKVIFILYKYMKKLDISKLELEVNEIIKNKIFDKYQY